MSGRQIDFDHIYFDVLRPALTSLGLTAQRADELQHGALIHTALLETIAASDVMVADVTTANANVMYELGLRHALRPSVTVMVMAAGSAVPFNIGLSRILSYEIGSDDRVTGESAQRLGEQLRLALRDREDSTIPDSPVYALLAGLQVVLPEHLRPARRQGATMARRGTPPPGLGSVAEQKLALKAIEEALRQGGGDAADYLALLRGYRDLSAWDDIVRVAGALPAEVAGTPEVRQLLALALNRRGGSGDQERAIELITLLVKETGADAETLVTLGRLYKDRHDRRRRAGDEAAAGDLARAIDAYGEAFTLDPSDTYAGLNLVTLLLQDGSAAAYGEMEKVLPRVRAAAQARMSDGAAGYWEFATALHLAVIAGDWTDAEQLAQGARSAASAPWMIDSTARDLEGLAESLDPSLQYGLRQMVGVLRTATVEERDYA